MFLLMGSHLFDPHFLTPFKDQTIVMIEDYGLCTHFRYHKQKIAFFLESMRNYRDLLRVHGFDVVYLEIDVGKKKLGFFDRLEKVVKEKNISELTSFTIEDKFFRYQINDFCIRLKLSWMLIKSPLFLNAQDEVDESLPDKHPLMRRFYEHERVSRNILMNNKKPLGGKFSFDSDNRLKLPHKMQVPPLPVITPSIHRNDVEMVVDTYFGNHPGKLAPWLPCTREQAKSWLKIFLQERFKFFGPYEDAMDEKYPFIFHSVLSPLLNCGLLTPQEVIDEAISWADTIPLNSLEGFIRQIVGWREFIRGIYEKFSTQEEQSNFFKHDRKLTASWYDGTTEIIPLDYAIKKAWRIGYCHHIERLMVVSNLMLLSEISPVEVYRWFMEMFIDSADWVMGPNVFGMGQFSDGGLFATKPYICGSNYILKMSSFKKGDWCDIVDGLYWRFIEKHRDFFMSQARSSMMPKMLDRMDGKRKQYLFERAEQFINSHTQ